MIWLACLPASIAATLLTWLLAPILPLFAEPHYGPVDNANGMAVEPRLPWWLFWFSTYDNSLLGDSGHKARWNDSGCYMQRVAWLFRNPAYLFEIDVTGARIKAGDLICVKGDPSIKNRAGGKAGWYWCSCSGYWNFKVIVAFGPRCLMWELGWKLQDLAKQKSRIALFDQRAQIVWSPRMTSFNASPA